MNAKWCFSVLIAILTLFGVSRNQVAVPNQEIVVEFANIQITSDEAQNAIANVKLQLLALGVENIKLKEESDGVLRISYYSDSDVASIKKRLSEDISVKLDVANHHQSDTPQGLPLDNDVHTYNLEVHEIQTASHTGLDLEAISVVELKSEDHRFFNPNVYASTEDIDANDSTVKVAYKLYAYNVIVIDNTSRKIPEVRAGPLC